MPLHAHVHSCALIPTNTNKYNTAKHISAHRQHLAPAVGGVRFDKGCLHFLVAFHLLLQHGDRGGQLPSRLLEHGQCVMWNAQIMCHVKTNDHIIVKDACSIVCIVLSSTWQCCTTNAYLGSMEPGDCHAHQRLLHDSGVVDALHVDVFHLGDAMVPLVPVPLQALRYTMTGNDVSTVLCIPLRPGLWWGASTQTGLLLGPAAPPQCGRGCAWRDLLSRLCGSARARPHALGKPDAPVVHSVHVDAGC